MPRVKFTSRTSIGGTMFEKDDVCSTLSQADCELACKHGWAEDLDGVIPSGELKPGVATLEVKPAVHKVGVK